MLFLFTVNSGISTPARLFSIVIFNFIAHTSNPSWKIFRGGLSANIFSAYGVNFKSSSVFQLSDIFPSFALSKLYPMLSLDDHQRLKPSIQTKPKSTRDQSAYRVHGLINRPVPSRLESRPGSLIRVISLQT